MTTSKSMVAFAVLAALSIVGKVWIAGLGHNFDLESWTLFSRLVLDGKNVYAETYRNPYGPVWSYICAGVEHVRVRFADGESIEGFHQTLALVLSLVDVSIAFLLYRHRSLAAGVFFLLNPVSWLITGFHTQFDNLAVLLGFSACLVLDREKDVSSGKFALAMALLGVSLAVKHVLIFFPLWLLAEPGASRLRRLAFLTPFFIFGASFLPFMADERGLEGVIEHVFLYDSFHLDAFFPHLVDSALPLKAIEALFSWVPIFSGFTLIMVVAMLSTGIRGSEEKPSGKIVSVPHGDGRLLERVRGPVPRHSAPGLRGELPPLHVLVVLDPEHDVSRRFGGQRRNAAGHGLVRGEGARGGPRKVAPERGAVRLPRSLPGHGARGREEPVGELIAP